MGQYIGLDFSLKDTAISIREDGKRIWRGKCPSDPGIIAQTVRKHADDPVNVVFETGPLATWFYHALMGKDSGRSALRHGMPRKFWVRL